MSFRNVFWLVLCAIILLLPSYVYASRGIAVNPVSPSGEQVRGDQWLFVVGVDTLHSLAPSQYCGERREGIQGRAPGAVPF